MTAPLAIFAFNRADLARALVASLAQNPGWRASRVYVFIDGPRTDAERSKTEAVRQFFEELDHPDLILHARTENIGLKASLSSGITQVCQTHDRVIVLEDDLELGPETLDYFNKALDLYKGDMRVWSICADIPELNGFGRDRAHFMPVGSSWGWATWSDRWGSYIGENPLNLAACRSRIFKDRFNVHGLRKFERMLGMEEGGRISSWYVHWHLTIVRNNGMSLFPPVPMLRNGGFGGGTHSSRFSLPNLFGLGEKNIGRLDFSFPDKVELDFEFTQRVIDSPEWRLLRFNALMGKIRRTIKSGFARR